MLGSYHTGLVRPPFKQAPVVAAVAGSMASSAIAGALTTGFWAGTIGSITYGAIAGAIGGALVSGVVSGALVSGVVSGALAETPDQPDFGSDGASRGILLNKAANDAQIPVVYGQRKVGGTRVFMEVTGSDNEYLHIVLALAEGEIEEISDIYFNGISITDARFG